MKKLLSVLLIGLMLPVSIISAQESDLEERVANLEAKMDEIILLLEGNQAPTSNNEETNNQNSEGGLRRVEDLPTNIDEGWKFVGLDDTRISYITIANIRYNDEFLFMDVEVEPGRYTSGHRYEEVIHYGFSMMQLPSDNDRQTAESKADELATHYYQLPTELIEDLELDLIQIDTEFNYNEITRNTIPYKLSFPIEEASTLLIEFGDDQVLEFELIP